jgi:hypothetical protein
MAAPVATCRAPALLLALAAAALLHGPTAAGETWFDPGASLRLIAAGFHYYDHPLLFGEENRADGLSQILARVTARGGVGRLELELHLLQVITLSTAPAAISSSTALPGATAALRYRAGEGSWRWAESPDVQAALQLDRANLRLAAGPLDITLGRQAVNFAQAYFWNPLDELLPFDPAAFDQDYKPGVDALRIDLATGSFSSLSLVAAAGRELSLEITPAGFTTTARPFADEPWYGSALLLRGRTNLRDWDLTLQAGKVYGGAQGGLGFSGELLGLALRGEAAWFRAGDPRTLTIPDPTAPGFQRTVPLIEDHLTAVLGLGRRLSSSLELDLEYLLNTGGDPADPEATLARQTVGLVPGMGKHQLGLSALWQAHPLLLSQLAAIYSLSDHSALLTPTLTYSIENEADCVIGALIGLGERPRTRRVQPDPDSPATMETLEIRSEYGAYPDVFFVEVKFYI